MDKIIIIMDGKVTEIEGKILHCSEEVGLLDITSSLDRFKKRKSNGIFNFNLYIDTNFNK